MKDLLAGHPTDRSWRNLAYFCVLLAVLTVAASAIAAVTWKNLQQAEERREAAETARCEASRVGVRVANQIVNVIRDDLYYRADLTQRIIDASPDDEDANKERAATVVFYRLQANYLPTFKAGTCPK